MKPSTPPPMLAFHNKRSVKSKYLKRVRAHAAADEIISGTYWENGKGCAVGCTLHSNQHAAYETELGIPQTLARLEDRLFEALYAFDKPAAKAWPERFLDAPRVGADLTLVWPRFAHWLLVDETYGVLRLAKSDGSKKSISEVAALYLRWINGEKPGRDEWERAYAAYAADSAAYAAYAAAYAAYAAAYAADSAAYAAYAGVAAFRNKHYSIMADKLIELMQSA